jgi:hypothetical protein
MCFGRLFQSLECCGKKEVLHLVPIFLCKKLEDSWIMRLGTLFFPGILNKRDEIKKKVRSGY